MLRTRRRTVVSAVLGLAFALALCGVVRADWVADGNDRYDPATNTFEHWDGAQWGPDPNPATNGAYLKWLAEGGADGAGEATPQRYSIMRAGDMTRHEAREASEEAFQYETWLMRQRGYDASTSDREDSGSEYKASKTPEWDWALSLAGEYTVSGYQVDPFGTDYKADAAGVGLGLALGRDRFRLLNSFHYDRSWGKHEFNGIRSDTVGLKVMPGYAVLLQETAGVDLNLFAVVDVSYTDTKGAGTVWHLTPGVVAGVRRWTRIGGFQFAYAFLHKRNLSGEEEITGDEHINVHAATLGYTVPVTRNLYADFGLDYSVAANTPAGYDEQALYGRIGLGAVNLKNWSIYAQYSHQLKWGDGKGVTASVSYAF